MVIEKALAALFLGLCGAYVPLAISRIASGGKAPGHKLGLISVAIGLIVAVILFTSM